jgi:hypothetical protein
LVYQDIAGPVTFLCSVVGDAYLVSRGGKLGALLVGRYGAHWRPHIPASTVLTYQVRTVRTNAYLSPQ